MPRTEARIFTSIWADPDFRALQRAPQGTYLFLVSQPDLSHAGVVPLRPGKWARTATGLTVAMLKKDLDVLSATPPFVVIDEGTSELLVRSLIRRDKILRSPKLMKPLKAALDMVESAVLRAVLAAELRRAVDEDDINPAVADEVSRMIKDLEPFPQVDTLSDTVSQKTAIGYGIPTGAGEGVSLTERSRKPAAAKACRIPPDFEVTPEMVAWARSKVPSVNGKIETEKFINFWRAKSGAGATKLDWPATWRNWMLNAAERNGQAPVQGSLPVDGLNAHMMRR